MSKPTLAVIVMEGNDLSPWQASQVGVPQFEACGLEVLIFHATPLLRVGAQSSVNLDGLAQRLDAAAHVVVFSYYDLRNFRMHSLADLLSVRGIPWTFVQTGVIPAPLPPRDLMEHVDFALFQIRRLRRKVGTVGVLRALLDKIRKLLFGHSIQSYPPKYALVDGLKSETNIAAQNPVIIPGHSRDYENKLVCGVEPDTSPEDICVFIDTNEARHSDWPLQGVAQSELPDDDTYRAHLLATFEMVERTTGLRVVVLPHPRFTYSADRFGRFELRPGDTMSAVANAKLVLGHYSTALSFAVIFNKPIILLTDALFRDCMGGRIDRHIRAFALEFGSRLVSMDSAQEADFADWMKIDAEKYARYLDNWIRHPGAPSGSMWKSALRFIARNEGFDGSIKC